MAEFFSEEYQWWSHADRDVLLGILDRLRPQTVLEFGPGMSTLAFVEHGIPWVDTFEDQPEWYGHEAPLLDPHPQIRRHLYTRRDPLLLPQALARYDLGFVDGPSEKEDRGPEIEYAVAHCKAVVLHDAGSEVIRDLARARVPGHLQLEMLITDREPDGNYGDGEWLFAMALITGM